MIIHIYDNTSRLRVNKSSSHLSLTATSSDTKYGFHLLKYHQL